MRGEKRIVWDVERVRYWLGVGAQPTESVVKLLERVSFARGFGFVALWRWFAVDPREGEVDGKKVGGYYLREGRRL